MLANSLIMDSEKFTKDANNQARKELILWEIDTHFSPINFAERMRIWKKFLSTMEEDMRLGFVDFGIFSDSNGGYAIFQGNGKKLFELLQKYRPLIKFTIKNVLTIEDVKDVIKTISKGK
jgi:hypothetical protein